MAEDLYQGINRIEESINYAREEVLKQYPEAEAVTDLMIESWFLEKKIKQLREKRDRAEDEAKRTHLMNEISALEDTQANCDKQAYLKWMSVVVKSEKPHPDPQTIRSNFFAALDKKEASIFGDN